MQTKISISRYSPVQISNDLDMSYFNFCHEIKIKPLSNKDSVKTILELQLC